ncbi:Serine/threonine-protein kinase mrck-1 [Grifola frondosa]|uniref:non-specific serine/threonine protein kinase n=1 Tax=Grifola frondosa TaxID=5627 RepID=A0A1C7MIK8_GRIFR|nr:Serine/threonine-protein kinase mrck-1 [Grifola frondosa]
MPLMHGDLFDFIRGRGDRRRTRRWVAQLALGIDALHRMGIIHRDIKPENVLLDMSTDTVRITDFNAAYFQPGNAPLEDGAVYTRLFIGSRPYIAPEVIRRQWYGKMVDWFALGCLVFDLVTGEVLFPDDREKERYMTWNAKEEGLSFLEWAGNLSDQEESIIAGLINVRSQSRLQLARLRQHPFFLDEQGINAFDTLAQPCAFTAPHSQEVHPALKNAPLVGVSPHACNSSQHPYDFRNFEWLNPRGPWKTA